MYVYVKTLQITIKYDVTNMFQWLKDCLIDRIGMKLEKQCDSKMVTVDLLQEQHSGFDALCKALTPYVEQKHQNDLINKKRMLDVEQGHGHAVHKVKPLLIPIAIKSLLDDVLQQTQWSKRDLQHKNMIEQCLLNLTANEAMWSDCLDVDLDQLSRHILISDFTLSKNEIVLHAHLLLAQLLLSKPIHAYSDIQYIQFNQVVKYLSNYSDMQIIQDMKEVFVAPPYCLDKQKCSAYGECCEKMEPCWSDECRVFSSEEERNATYAQHDTWLQEYNQREIIMNNLKYGIHLTLTIKREHENQCQIYLQHDSNKTAIIHNNEDLLDYQYRENGISLDYCIREATKHIAEPKIDLQTCLAQLKS